MLEVQMRANEVVPNYFFNVNSQGGMIVKRNRIMKKRQIIRHWLTDLFSKAKIFT